MSFQSTKLTPIGTTDTIVFEVPVLSQTLQKTFVLNPKQGLARLTFTNTTSGTETVTVKLKRALSDSTDTIGVLSLNASETKEYPVPLTLEPADRILAAGSVSGITVSGVFTATEVLPQKLDGQSFWTPFTMIPQVGQYFDQQAAWRIATKFHPKLVQAIVTNEFGADLTAEYGGYYGGMTSLEASTGVPGKVLIVSPAEFDDGTYQWATATGESDPDNDIDGALNTQQLIAKNGTNNVEYPAAMRVNTINTTGGINGFTDWYLPARYEQQVLYWNLKPTTATNTTSNPDRLRNPYHVPLPITTDVVPEGPPIQTRSVSFQSGNGQAYVAANYWSSAQGSVNGAWSQAFSSGNLSVNGKTVTRRVRVVRGLKI